MDYDFSKMSDAELESIANGVNPSESQTEDIDFSSYSMEELERIARGEPVEMRPKGDGATTPAANGGAGAGEGLDTIERAQLKRQAETGDEQYGDGALGAIRSVGEMVAPFAHGNMTRAKANWAKARQKFIDGSVYNGGLERFGGNASVDERFANPDDPSVAANFLADATQGISDQAEALPLIGGAIGWAREKFQGATEDSLMEHLVNQARQTGLGYEDIDDSIRKSKGNPALFFNDFAQKVWDTEQHEQKVRNDARKKLGENPEDWQDKIIQGVIDNAGYTGEFMVGGALAKGAKLGRIGRFALQNAVPAVSSAATRKAELEKDEYAFDENGNRVLVSKGDDNALVKAAKGGIAEAAVETGTDAVIDYLLSRIPGASAAGKAIAKSIRKTDAGKAILNGLETYRKYASVTGVNGAPVEVLEEDIQGFIDNVMGWDKKDSEYEGASKEWQKFKNETLTAEGQLDTFLSLLGTMAIQGGSAMAKAQYQLANDRRDARSSLKAALPHMADRIDGYDTKTLNFLRDLITHTEEVKGVTNGKGRNVRKFSLTPDGISDLLNGISEKYGERTKERMEQVVNDVLSNDNTAAWLAATDGESDAQFTIPQNGDGQVLWDVGEDGRRSMTDVRSGITITEEIAPTAELPGLYQITDGKGHFAGADTVDGAMEAANALAKYRATLDNSRDAKYQMLDQMRQSIGRGLKLAAADDMDAVLEQYPDIADSDGFNPLNEAVTLDDGTVVLIMDNINSPMQMEQKLLHEAGIHMGLRLTHPKDKVGFMRKIAPKEVNAMVKAVARAYGVTPEQVLKDDRLLEEVVAHTNERTLRSQGAMQKAVSLVREGLRKAGMDLDYSDAELAGIVQEMVERTNDGDGILVRWRGITQEDRNLAAEIQAEMYAEDGASADNQAVGEAVQAEADSARANQRKEDFAAALEQDNGKPTPAELKKPNEQKPVVVADLSETPTNGEESPTSTQSDENGATGVQSETGTTSRPSGTEGAEAASDAAGATEDENAAVRGENKYLPDEYIPFASRIASGELKPTNTQFGEVYPTGRDYGIIRDADGNLHLIDANGEQHDEVRRMDDLRRPQPKYTVRTKGRDFSKLSAGGVNENLKFISKPDARQQFLDDAFVAAPKFRAVKSAELRDGLNAARSIETLEPMVEEAGHYIGLDADVVPKGLRSAFEDAQNRLIDLKAKRGGMSGADRSKATSVEAFAKSGIPAEQGGPAYDPDVEERLLSGGLFNMPNKGDVLYDLLQSNPSVSFIFKPQGGGKTGGNDETVMLLADELGFPTEIDGRGDNTSAVAQGIIDAALAERVRYQEWRQRQDEGYAASSRAAAEEEVLRLSQGSRLTAIREGDKALVDEADARAAAEANLNADEENDRANEQTIAFSRTGYDWSNADVDTAPAISDPKQLRSRGAVRFLFSNPDVLEGTIVNNMARAGAEPGSGAYSSLTDTGLARRAAGREIGDPGAIIELYRRYYDSKRNGNAFETFAEICDDNGIEPSDALFKAVSDEVWSPTGRGLISDMTRRPNVFARYSFGTILRAKMRDIVNRIAEESGDRSSNRTKTPIEGPKPNYSERRNPEYANEKEYPDEKLAEMAGDKNGGFADLQALYELYDRYMVRNRNGGIIGYVRRASAGNGGYMNENDAMDVASSVWESIEDKIRNGDRTLYERSLFSRENPFRSIVRAIANNRRADFLRNNKLDLVIDSPAREGKNANTESWRKKIAADYEARRDVERRRALNTIENIRYYLSDEQKNFLDRMLFAFGLVKEAANGSADAEKAVSKIAEVTNRPVGVVRNEWEEFERLIRRGKYLTDENRAGGVGGAEYSPRELVEMMPPEMSDIASLRLDGMTESQIARELGKSVENVRNQLANAVNEYGIEYPPYSQEAEFDLGDTRSNAGFVKKRSSNRKPKAAQGGAVQRSLDLYATPERENLAQTDVADTRGVNLKDVRERNVDETPKVGEVSLFANQPKYRGDNRGNWEYDGETGFSRTKSPSQRSAQGTFQFSNAEVDSVVSRYTRKDGSHTPSWLKAPNGKPSNLTPDQWVMVRTKAFKDWFGDWEAAEFTKGWYDVQEPSVLTGIAPTDISGVRPLADKKEIGDAFVSFGEVTNDNDGRKVRFPRNAAGKMIPVKDYVSAFDRLFKSSVRIYSEGVLEKVNHKSHDNISAIHQYANRFTDGSGDYFIRFTVREARTGNSVTDSHVHDARVSDVELYKIEAPNLPGIKTGRSGAPRNATSGFTDDKIALFLNPVNRESVSKVVDENGEPLVVYHGTIYPFNRFSESKRGKHDYGWFGRGFYFFAPVDGDVDTAMSAAKDYGGRVIPAFVNIKNPNRTSADETFTPSKESSDSYSDDAAKRGEDGTIAEHGDVDEIVVFNPSQIKSADPVTYDDAGNVIPLSQRFNSSNTDIRWSNADVEGDFVGISVERMNELRAKYGLPPLERSRVIGDEEVEREAAGLLNNRDELDTIIAAINKTPRAMSEKEVVAAGMRERELSDAYAEKIAQADEAVQRGNNAQAAERRSEADEILKQLDFVQSAIRKSGSVTGRSLRLYRSLFDRNLTLAGLTSECQALAGRKLTDGEKADIREAYKAVRAALDGKDGAALREMAKRIRYYIGLEVDKMARGVKDDLKFNPKASAEIEGAYQDALKALDSWNDVSGGILTGMRDAKKNLNAIVRMHIANGIGEGHEGRAKYDALMAATLATVKEHLPDATMEELEQEISQYGISRPASIDETEAEIRRVDGMARRLRALDSLLTDKKVPLKTGDATQPMDPVLKQMDADLRRRVMEMAVNGELAPEEVKKLIDRRLAQLDRRLDAYRRQMLTDGFRKPADRMPQLTSPEIAEKERDLKAAERKVRQMRTRFREINHPLNFQIGQNYASDYWNLFVSAPRVLRTMIDLSATGAQGAALFTSHPVEGTKALWKSIKAFYSEKRADEIQLALDADKDWEEFQRFGGHAYAVTDVAQGDAPEEFRLADRTLKFGKREFSLEDIPGVKASERSFAAFLNCMNLAMYKAMKNGGGWMDGAGPTDMQKRDLCEALNVASGYGYGNEVTGWWDRVMSTAFWAPRFFVSGIKQAVGYEVWSPFVRGGKNERKKGERVNSSKQLAKEEVRRLTAMAAWTFLFTMLFGKKDPEWMDEVTDPRSSHFMNVRIGKSEVNFLGPMKQWIVFMSRFANGNTYKNGVAKPTRKMNAIGRIVRGKLSPLMGLGFDIFGGETFIGEKLDWSLPPLKRGKGENGKDTISGIGHTLEGVGVPLSLADLKEAWMENGLANAMMIAPFAITGFSKSAAPVSDYDLVVEPYKAARREYDKLVKAKKWKDAQDYFKAHPILSRRQSIDNAMKSVSNYEHSAKKAADAGREVPKGIADYLARSQQRVIDLVRGSK